MMHLIYLFIQHSDILDKSSIYCSNVKSYFDFCRVRESILFGIGAEKGIFLRKLGRGGGGRVRGWVGRLIGCSKGFLGCIGFIIYLCFSVIDP